MLTARSFIWFLVQLQLHSFAIVQVVILLILPNSIGSSGANYAKNLLRLSFLVQYLPRLYRFLPLLVGQSPSGFIFESAWANFVINLLTFVLSGHIVGSCWYLFGLQVWNSFYLWKLLMLLFVLKGYNLCTESVCNSIHSYSLNSYDSFSNLLLHSTYLRQANLYLMNKLCRILNFHDFLCRLEMVFRSYLFSFVLLLCL